MTEKPMDEDVARGLYDLVNNLIAAEALGKVSIEDVSRTVDYAIVDGIENLLLVTAIVFIGIGDVSKARGGRSAQELLMEMTEDLERMGGKWN